MWHVLYCTNAFSIFLGAAFAVCSSYALLRDIRETGRRRAEATIEGVCQEEPGGDGGIDKNSPQYVTLSKAIIEHFSIPGATVRIAQWVGGLGALFYLVLFFVFAASYPDQLAAPQCLPNLYVFSLYLIFPLVILAALSVQIIKYAMFRHSLNSKIEFVRDNKKQTEKETITKSIEGLLEEENKDKGDDIDQSPD